MSTTKQIIENALAEIGLHHNVSDAMSREKWDELPNEDKVIETLKGTQVIDTIETQQMFQDMLDEWLNNVK